MDYTRFFGVGRCEPWLYIGSGSKVGVKITVKVTVKDKVTEMVRVKFKDKVRVDIKVRVKFNCNSKSFYTALVLPSWLRLHRSKYKTLSPQITNG